MLAPAGTRKGRKPRRRARKAPPGLGMRVIGPAAPASQTEDSRDAEWEGVRTFVAKLARRMNTPTDEEIKKRSRPKGKVKHGKKKRRRKIRKDAGVRSAPSSLEDEDDLTQFGRSNFVDDTIEPPFDMIALVGLYENSGSLRQNIDAMATNVDGFGHHFNPVLDFTNPEINNLVRDILVRQKLENVDDLMGVSDTDLGGPPLDELQKTAQRWGRIAAIELGRIESFFAFINPVIPFVKLRRRTREDLELLGNAAWEVIRKEGTDSKIDQVYHVPFVNMRLIRADREPQIVDMVVRKDPIHFETVPVERFFRRYVRITGTMRTYYKEFGDPRTVSRKTGRIYDTPEALIEAEGKDTPQANELFHWKIRSPISAYGVPRWIGALISVLGNRAAEEVNFLYFDNKGMPPMVLLVSGGRVTESSVERIESIIEDRVKGRENFHKIMVIEALPASADVDSGGEIEHSGRMRLELKPLVREMQQDAMFQEYDRNNQIKIGRSFRQPPIMTGDTRDMNRSCYSEDTETLTENGWKLIDEIASDEKVAAYDPESHRIDFVVPAGRHVHEVEDELLYHFENAHTDVMVTAEHKMLMRPFYQRSENETRWRGVEAKDLTNTRFRFRVAPGVGTWQGIPGECIAATMTIPRLGSCTAQRKDGHKHEQMAMDDFLEFLGYWISEGSLLQTEDPMSPHWVLLSQKKPHIREKIQVLLDRLPWRYSAQESRDGTTRWKISNKCLRDYLLKNCGGKSGDKRIPVEFMHSDRRSTKILYQALMDGDGTVDSRENRTARIYYTKSTMLADQVQEIALLLGYRTRITPGAGVWRVEHSEHNETCLARDRHLKLVPYTGRVYCFAVPSHGYFVTRRNGKVAIQGNTAQVAKALTEEQVYQPERDDFDAVMDCHFLTDQKIHFWRFKTNAPVTRIPSELVEMARKALDAGAVTANEMRQLLADAFSIPLPHRADDWARQPPKAFLAAVRQGGFAGTDNLEGMDLDMEGDAADQVDTTEGEVLARGFTNKVEDHKHAYVALRQKNGIKVVLFGRNEHEHQLLDEIQKDVSPGDTLTLKTADHDGHEHEIILQIPLKKNRRPSRASAAAMALTALRGAVLEEFEEAKDEWLLARHEEHALSVD